MMKVFYYFYYLFYTKVLPDDEPYATTIFTLSFSESLLVNGILDITAAHVFCTSLGKWAMIGVFLFILGVNYLLYHRKGQARKIVEEEKPLFFNNNRLSVIITFLFFIVTTSFLFWGSSYVRDVLDQCK